MIRFVLAMIGYGIGGFFIYIANLLAFIDIEGAGYHLKLFVMAIYFVPGVIALFIGGGLRIHHRPMRDMGIVLLVVVVLTTVVGVMYSLVALDPPFPRESLKLDFDLRFGCSVTLLFALIAALLLYKGIQVGHNKGEDDPPKTASKDG